MTAAEWRAALAARGFRLTLVDGELSCQVPGGADTPALRQVLEASRPELLALLRAEEHEHEGRTDSSVLRNDEPEPDGRGTTQHALSALVEKVGVMQQYWQRHAHEWDDAEYERRRDILLSRVDRMDGALARAASAIEQHGWSLTPRGTWHRLAEGALFTASSVAPADRAAP